MEINQTVQRRSFLGKAGLMAAGALAAVNGERVIQPHSAEAQSTSVNWPFPFAELSPDYSALLGYDGFYEGACCYGTFKALIAQWAELMGEPFSHIPIDMMRYGEGGITGWGSVCGTINGASAAINLVCKFEDAKTLINELIAWYSETALPIYVPPGKASIVSNVSNSPLCHVSVSKWCNLANAGATTPERKERCARLVADVASKTSEILNDHFQSKFVSQHSPAPSVSGCMQCHGSTAKNNTLGKMDCVSCHEPANHPLPISNWGEY